MLRTYGNAYFSSVWIYERIQRELGKADILLQIEQTVSKYGAVFLCSMVKALYFESAVNMIASERLVSCNVFL